MRALQAHGWTRRRFLSGLALAGTTGLLGWHPRPVAAEPSLETTTLTLVQLPNLCVAPQYVAEALLRAEGFHAVHYVKTIAGGANMRALATGEAHLSTEFAGPFIISMDAGHPLVALAGVHVGCFELFGTECVRTIRDLKGKTVAVPALQSTQHIFLASIAAHVGIDPRQDITWVTYPRAEAKQLLAEGKIDAFLGFPPDPQELWAKQIGHVVVNSAVDRPWSQYFCCLLAGNREFVRTHPVATKRAVRAILKAADLCALEPARAARLLVDQGGYTQHYDYALQTMQEVPYGKWREYEPRIRCASTPCACRRSAW